MRENSATTEAVQVKGIAALQLAALDVQKGVEMAEKRKAAASHRILQEKLAPVKDALAQDASKDPWGQTPEFQSMLKESQSSEWLNPGGILDVIKPDKSTRAAIKKGLGLAPDAPVAAAPVVAVATSEVKQETEPLASKLDKIKAFALRKAGVTAEQFAKLAPIIKGSLQKAATPRFSGASMAIHGSKKASQTDVPAEVTLHDEILDTSDKTLRHLGIQKEAKSLKMPPLPKPAPAVAVQTAPVHEADEHHDLLRQTLHSVPGKTKEAKAEAKAVDDAAAVLNIKPPGSPGVGRVRTHAVPLNPVVQATADLEAKSSFKVAHKPAATPKPVSEDEVRPEDAELMRIAAADQNIADHEEAAAAHSHRRSQGVQHPPSPKASKRKPEKVNKKASEDDVRPADAELMKIAAEAEDTAAPTTLTATQRAATKRDLHKKLAEKSTDDALAVKRMMHRARREASHRVAPQPASEVLGATPVVDMTKMSSAQLKAFVAAAKNKKVAQVKSSTAHSRTTATEVLHPSLIVTKQARQRQERRAVAKMDTGTLQQIVKLAAQRKAAATRRNKSKKSAIEKVDWHGAF